MAELALISLGATKLVKQLEKIYLNMLKIDKNDLNGSLTDIEFFAFEGEVWFNKNGEHIQLAEKHTELVNSMIELISTFYPKAYDALCKHYESCARNKWYYRFRIVSRFIKCNFAQLDDIYDIDADGRCHFEYVSCPLRGECLFDRIVCRPEFDHKLSASELPVMRLWYQGASIDEIASCVFLSPHTVRNHIRHAYARTGTHSRGEFAKYAAQNNLFK
ncbi:MAG: helix-turn-helix transcriptional regulator [Bacteroides sp.]|nr:helix-turn-helix transcriptional regulator [Bacteroides sp.]MCM1446339.1 helix-turn-helix transcriptional regulator [Prevotella sp.]